MLVRRYEKNTTGRDWAVGDIHGYFNRLQQRLDEAGFDPDKGDRLFSVGDLVDRGPDCDQVLDWIGRPWFHAVQGNHEDMAIRWPKGKQVDGRLVRNMDPYLYACNGGGWNIANPEHLQEEISQCLACLPVAIEVETEGGLVAIVHADVYGHSWEKFKARLEMGGIIAQEAIDACQWSRERFHYGDESLISDVRAVVVGHTPVDEVVVLGNTHYIDTMGWHRGHFTLLDLETLKPVGGMHE